MDDTLNIQVGDWPVLVMEDSGELRSATAAELPSAGEQRALDGLKRGRLYAVESELDFEEAACCGGFAETFGKRVPASQSVAKVAGVKAEVGACPRVFVCKSAVAVETSRRPFCGVEQLASSPGS